MEKITMCLYAKKNTKPQIATEDITCWRIAVKGKGKEEYYSPYMGEDNNPIDGKTIVGRMGKFPNGYKCEEFRTYDAGWVHAYLSQEEAERRAVKLLYPWAIKQAMWPLDINNKKFIKLDETPCCVVKCVIRKGTEYIKGYTAPLNKEENTICARQMDLCGIVSKPIPPLYR